MSHSPTVTVLMSVYNGEKYLAEAVDSILNQTYTDFEFLIINDGSTDASRSIICAYHDSRIRLVDNPQNVGLSRSLNRGLSLAQGKYVARQDADDISEPQRLARQVAFMEANPHLLMSGTWYREIDADGNWGDNVRLPGDSTELRWLLLFTCPFIHTAAIMRKTQLLQEVGFYNESCYYAMDYELWFRIAQRCPVTNLPDYLVRYRINPYSMTATYGEITNEGIELRARTVAALLGWVDRHYSLNEATFRKMFTVLYGEDVTLNLEEVIQVTSTIWQLHQAFCSALKLSPPTVEKHRHTLRAWLSKRYLRIALYYAAKGWYKQAQQLYIQAVRLHLRTFFVPKSARLLYRLLLIQPIRALRSQLQNR
jgi:glycosyltransferase involved in cell wall biosynthesis